MTDQRRYPYENLAPYVAGIATQTLADAIGVSRESLHRWRRNGLNCEAVDQACIAIGMHPAEVWPEWSENPYIDYPGDHGSWAAVKRHQRAGERCSTCLECSEFLAEATLRRKERRAAARGKVTA